MKSAIDQAAVFVSFAQPKKHIKGEMTVFTMVR